MGSSRLEPSTSLIVLVRPTAQFADVLRFRFEISIDRRVDSSGRIAVEPFAGTFRRGVVRRTESVGVLRFIGIDDPLDRLVDLLGNSAVDPSAGVVRRGTVCSNALH